jgi:hypothetical protein
MRIHREDSMTIRVAAIEAMRRYIAEERAPDPGCTSDGEPLAFRARGSDV